MAKKIRKTKEKIKTNQVNEKKIETKDIVKVINHSKYMLASLLVIITIIALVVNFYYKPGMQSTYGEEPTSTPQVISGITQSGGSCTINSECFLAGCKNSNVLECVNTIQMDNYNEKCGGIYSYTVVTDFSRCSCIQGSCRTV